MTKVAALKVLNLDSVRVKKNFQEYASSDNCRMELQFAGLTLKKHIIATIVGEGTDLVNFIL